MHNDNLPYWLALWRTPHIGPKTFSQLIILFPQLSDLFVLPIKELQALGLPENVCAGLQKPDWLGVERDLAWANQPQHNIVCFDSDLYPHSLKSTVGAPPLLFIAGDMNLINSPQLAIVGSRHPSPSGEENAYRFARHFAQVDLVITSGLALGIDTASHKGALSLATGKTIAIMGTGADRIYPSSNHNLAEQIIAQGALVTEFATGIPPLPQHFPRRNRLISGLSLGTLVVEAARDSGSLITVQYALEQGREVFAIPGDIHNPLSRGCHYLIRQGAKLVETAQDVLEELGSLTLIKKEGISTSGQAHAIEKDVSMLTDEQAKILSLLDFSATSIDTLIYRSRLTADTVSSILLLLELQGFIIAAPGGYIKLP